MDPQAPIGVFDSGIGGLTVLRELVHRMPGEDFVYLGDTARVPYGTKSAGTVIRFSGSASSGSGLGLFSGHSRSLFLTLLMSLTATWRAGLAGRMPPGTTTAGGRA